MTTPFAQALREQLMQAAVREQRRRRRTKIGAAVSAALAAIVSSVVLLAPNPAGADVEVTVENGIVEVRLTDLHSSPQDVIDALREKGLTATVDALPTGPSGVGRFVRVHVIGDVQVTVTPSGRNGNAFTSFTIPEDWEGRLVISLGRAAEPGEAYEAFTDAFAEGEPLHCRGVFGRRIADVVDELEDLTVGIAVYRDGVFVGQVPLDEALRRGDGGLVIIGGGALAADHVVLDAEATEPRAEPGC